MDIKDLVRSTKKQTVIVVYLTGAEFDTLGNMYEEGFTHLRDTKQYITDPYYKDKDNLTTAQKTVHDISIEAYYSGVDYIIFEADFDLIREVI